MQAHEVRQLVLRLGKQPLVRTQSFPDAFENAVDKVPPVEGVQSRRCLVRHPGAEAQFGEGLEGTGRLEREQVGPSAERRIAARRAAVVVYGLYAGSVQELLSVTGRCEEPQVAGRSFRQRNEKGADPEIRILLPFGMADDNRRCARKQAAGEHPVVRQFPRRGRPGQLETALQAQGKKRIVPPDRRPGAVVHAHDPEPVEAEAGGFEQAQDLDRRARRFGLKHPG